MTQSEKITNDTVVSRFWIVIAYYNMFMTGNIVIQKLVSITKILNFHAVPKK